jgi:hypothetical protein
MADKCYFWGKIYPDLVDNYNLDEKYEIVLERFSELYDSDCQLVDSSKKDEPLELLHGRPDVDVKAVFLIKDVRAYTISHLDNHTSSNSAIYLFWQWYGRNKAKKALLERLRVDFLQMGYEELCLGNPGLQDAFRRSQNHHIIRGNQMRHKEHISVLQYDNRWFVRREWIIPSLLFPTIMAYNSREVYKGAHHAMPGL